MFCHVPGVGGRRSGYSIRFPLLPVFGMVSPFRPSPLRSPRRRAACGETLIGAYPYGAWAPVSANQTQGARPPSVPTRSLAPAPTRRTAASGCRVLPPHLGAARSAMKLFARSISDFCGHYTYNTGRKPSSPARGLGEGCAKRGIARQRSFLRLRVAAERSFQGQELGPSPEIGGDRLPKPLPPPTR